jgi:hypothetical protein
MLGSPLHDAAMHGDVEQLHALLKNRHAVSPMHVQTTS